MNTNPWLVAIFVALVILIIIFWLGVGFVIYLATISDDEHEWGFKDRAKFILGWPWFALRIMFKGIPKKK